MFYDFQPRVYINNYSLLIFLSLEHELRHNIIYHIMMCIEGGVVLCIIFEEARARNCIKSQVIRADGTLSTNLRMEYGVEIQRRKCLSREQ